MVYEALRLDDLIIISCGIVLMLLIVRYMTRR